MSSSWFRNSLISPGPTVHNINFLSIILNTCIEFLLGDCVWTVLLQTGISGSSKLQPVRIRFKEFLPCVSGPKIIKENCDVTDRNVMCTI